MGNIFPDFVRHLTPYFGSRLALRLRHIPFEIPYDRRAIGFSARQERSWIMSLWSTKNLDSFDHAKHNALNDDGDASATGCARTVSGAGWWSQECPAA